MTDQQLLELIKQKYPIGTVYCPVHLDHSSLEPDNLKTIINYDNITFGHSSGYIIDETDYNRIGYTSTLYNHVTGEWAKILAMPNNDIDSLQTIQF